MLRLKQIFMLVVTLSLVIVVAGCGGPKLSPEATMQIYANMAVKADFSEYSKIGMTEDDLQKMKDMKEQAYERAAKVVFAQGQMKPNDEAKAKFKDIVLKMGNMMEVKTEPVSKDDNTAVVKVSVKSIDQNGFLNEILLPKLQERIQAKAADPNFDWNKEGAVIFMDTFAELLDQAKLQAEPTVFEVKCVVDQKTNCWRPEKPEEFKQNIMKATDGM